MAPGMRMLSLQVVLHTRHKHYDCHSGCNEAGKACWWYVGPTPSQLHTKRMLSGLQMLSMVTLALLSSPHRSDE